MSGLLKDYSYLVITYLSSIFSYHQYSLNLFKGLAALVGFSGVCMFPYLEGSFGLELTAIGAIWY